MEGSHTEELPRTYTERKNELGGYPVHVVTTKNDHTFELDEHALKKILLQNHIMDLNVVVVSIAGAFRKGKSFLLDFFLRYLTSRGDANWLGDENKPLEGFSWRGGSERETTGILLWSEVFVWELPNGEEVAILLMDTQGSFDSESTVKDCATVFALSTMLSSVQIYNILHNIQEDDLQHLQLFTEYGRLALQNSTHKPFQKLLFLVRDWSFPYEAEYGTIGGKTILNRRLQVTEKQHLELQSLREYIRACFQEVSCFLMPHPGLKVATHPDFNGKLADIESDFKKNLKILIPMVLSPENLLTKVIGGQKVKVKELITYFKSYMDIYKRGDLPEPKSLLLATAEGNNLAAIADARDLYKNMMDKVCGCSQPYLNTEQMIVEHNRIKKYAIQNFQDKRKMGGDKFSQKYKEGLIVHIEEMFSDFKLLNENKNIFKAGRTPAVYFTLCVVLYILSIFSEVLGFYSITHSCNFLMGFTLLILILWLYIRYSGEMREVGSLIDEWADFLWENLIKPLYIYGMRRIVHGANETAEAVIQEDDKNKYS